ncbi:hypothetical protein MNB_SV-3-738 [hydrothermal vent metagenome]|uniref:Uncharacterized protein n=1 Tax=hydrothermal vent metagenome TaxID=652676 RepID=A0A1W1BCE8_9ZZZZ
MIHLKRVALEIKTVGLYDLILQDVIKIAKTNSPSEDKILEIIKTYPQILEDYKQLNVEYNISNIHLRDIDIAKIDEPHKEDAKQINKNLAYLQEIEKYTLDFEQSSTLVIIFSLEFFILFSVQYFIVLLDLKEWQWYIYGIFASSILYAYMYAQKEKKLYAKNSVKFEELYEETLELLNKLESNGAIKKSDLIIEECEEHV